MTQDNLLSPATSFALFNDQTIRKEWHNGEWYFSVVDVVEILTDSKDSKQYIKKILMRDPILKSNWGTICTLVQMHGKDWKKRKVQASNNQGLLRIIQSIPSPNAEPLKQWLATIGNERLEEIDDPEAGIIRARKRAISAYKAKGWSDGDIKQRLDMIDARHSFTDLLKDLGVEDTKAYGIITNMTYSWSDMTAKEYKEFKWLYGKNDNLRDHMSKPEMLLTQLAEEAA